MAGAREDKEGLEKDKPALELFGENAASRPRTNALAGFASRFLPFTCAPLLAGLTLF
jgi:hypothetical protein